MKLLFAAMSFFKPNSRGRTSSAVLALLALVVTASTANAQAPSLELHELDFYVHIDTLGSDPIGDYQAAVDNALIDAQFILQGKQGPVDSPCCTELTSGASVKTFGSPGDGRNIIDFGADLAAMEVVAEGGEAVFIVDALSLCGGQPATDAIGCAETPGSIQVVTLGALGRDLLGATIAHERGHNASLVHVTPNDCDMMQAVAGGSCLSVSDCTAYRNASTLSMGSCPCFANSSSKLPDGDVCTDGGLTGVCSGGLCGEVGTEASVSLVGSAFSNAFSFENRITGSGLSGDWQIEGTFGSSAKPTGLAYAADRDVLYGVQEAGANGELIEIDRTTGNVTSTRTLLGRPGLIALAYDPGGPGPADDRLLAVDRRPAVVEPPSQIEELIEIDPDDDSVSGVSALCPLVNNSYQTTNGFFSGLAYDTATNQLLGNGEAGLFSIQPDCSFVANEIEHPGTFDDTIVNLAHSPGALAYSEATGLTFMIGNQMGPRTLFMVVDGAATPAPFVETPLGLDNFTPGALAAIPIPEARPQALGAVALLVLAGLRRRASAS